jgi:hypothetical protein
MQNNNLKWQIRGTYNEACASEGQCPFYLGRDKEGGCQYFMVIRIQAGWVDDVDVSGTTVIYCGVITYSKYEELVKNGEEVAIYISDSSTPAQRKVLDPFVRSGMGVYLIQKAYGVKYVQIDAVEEGDTFSAKMPFGEMQQKLTKGLDGTPVRLENQVVPPLSNVKLCHSPFWRYSDYGRSYEFFNRCAAWADYHSKGGL